MAEAQDKCVKPARGVITPQPAGQTAVSSIIQEVPKMTARVGQEAIDFEANAYVEGKGFQPIKLSDYKGKWVVLCFYPGDFTFV